MSNRARSAIRALVAVGVVSATLVITGAPSGAEFPSDCTYQRESDLSTFVTLENDYSTGALRFGGQVTCYGGGDLTITALTLHHPETLTTVAAPAASCSACEQVTTSELVSNNPGYYQVVMQFQVNGGDVLTRSSDFFHPGFGEPFQSCTNLMEGSVWGCVT